MSGPLAGLTVVELAGVGPGPFAGMVLGDLGADVVMVSRPGQASSPADPLQRGRRSVVVDLRRPEGAEIVLRLAETADMLIEPFRPGVAERLGVGPDACLARNSGLLYGRMTGWGQDGPYAPNAGHDLNYIALAGALEGSGRAGGPPTFAQNLVGDFGGGGMLLVVGLLAALHERSRSGQGQVVDAAMVDGSALLTAFVRGMRAGGAWPGPRGTNLLDSGAHNYDVYETADGRWVSIATVEPQFYATLLRLLGLEDDVELRDQWQDRDRWPALKERLAAVFRTRTRAQWCEVFEGEPQMCFAPVLDLDEAPRHPHNIARGTYVTIDGIDQPAPAPRFSRTPPATPSGAPPRGADTDEVLRELGYDAEHVAGLRTAGVVG